MNSQLLTKINIFIKKRLIELSGVLLVILSLFLLTSIFSYSPDDPSLIGETEKVDIKNFGGFYGSIISDFFLQSIGLIFILLSLTILVWGFKVLIDKKIDNFISKIFFILLYVIFGTTFLNISFDHSYLLKN